MKRTVIKIDEQLCNGCGNCIAGCHEGALQLVNGKAVMISDLYCDGLGACIGECPVDAISFEEREAEAYDEAAVMERLIPGGPEVIQAHLKHLKEHGENKWFDEGVNFLEERGIEVDFAPEEKKLSCGCPGTMAREIKPSQPAEPFRMSGGIPKSQLTHFPVQLSLINPEAEFFRGSNLLLAADCTAFACGGFHDRILKGRTLAVACPKLDADLQNYRDKITRLIDNSQIATLTVAIMEVPCCRGLLKIANEALERGHRSIPVKLLILSVKGEVLKEEWM